MKQNKLLPQKPFAMVSCHFDRCFDVNIYERTEMNIWGAQWAIRLVQSSWHGRQTLRHLKQQRPCQKLIPLMCHQHPVKSLGSGEEKSRHAQIFSKQSAANCSALFALNDRPL